MTKLLCLLLFILFIPYSFACAQPSLTRARATPIDTSFLIKINGVDQYLEIKGSSRSHPVLLFVHGGPLWPATPLIRKYNQELTKDFILVSWDQRNCGKSKTDSSAILTPDLYVEDAHQVTQYLKKEFFAKKILLVCHSWGTIIGIKSVVKYPEDYSAYIGLGQFVNPNKSEILAREFVAAQAKLNNDTTTLQALHNIPFTEENGYKNGFEDLIKFSGLANRYFKNDAVATLANPMELYDDYAKVDWFTPLMTYGKVLFNYMNATRIDFFPVTNFKIPVYFFAGRYDHNTSSVVVERYFKTIKAPVKKMYWFEQSGHSPNWEEPALFHQRVLQIAFDNKMK